MTGKAGGSITIEGRDFTIERSGDGYVLTGVRGARYRTMRNVNSPHLMFLVNAKNWARHAPGVWLSDKSGQLKQVKLLSAR